MKQSRATSGVAAKLVEGLVCASVMGSTTRGLASSYHTEQFTFSASISLERGGGSNPSYPYVAHPWGYTIHHCFHFENVFTPVFTPLLIFACPEVVIFQKGHLFGHRAPDRSSQEEAGIQSMPEGAVVVLLCIGVCNESSALRRDRFLCGG